MGVYFINGTDLENTAYDLTGSLLSQAYDIDGNELFDDGAKRVIIVSDDSTGQASGYNLMMQTTGDTYILREVVDFLSDSPNFQSFCYDSLNNVFYKFDASTTVKIYNTNMQKIGTITLSSTAGHNNDAYYDNGKVYMPDGQEYIDGIYVWNVSANTVTHIRVTGISQPSNGSTRAVEALCGAQTEGYLYLLTRDFTSNALVHDPDDKLAVYLYNMSTNEAVLQAEFPWDCVYLQGAALYNDILYVACNTQTYGDAGNYAGITLKAIRTDKWEQLNSLVLSGNVEPESLNVYPLSDTPQLMMGIGKYQVVSEETRFTIPYRLV